MENKAKHILLGAGGAIASVLTEELLAHDEKVTLVSRSGHTRAGAESVKGDLLDRSSLDNIINDSAIVYLLAGLPYDSRIWQAQWPVIMDNVIDVCARKQARLLFFDNVYAYGKVDGAMTEATPLQPTSIKGRVRENLVDRLMNEVGKGNLQALIARAADFYGPYSEKVSFPHIFHFNRMASGKPAQALVNADRKHSYTYTGDCGKALYLLANCEEALGQIWHLPTATPALTDKEFIELAAKNLGVEPKYTILRKWMVRLAGLFDRTTKEVYEMLYQNEFDYIFDSSKFDTKFNFTPTPYEQGIAETIEFYKLKSR